MQRIIIESIDRTSGNENNYQISFPGGRVPRVIESRINSLSFPVEYISNIIFDYNDRFRIFYSDVAIWGIIQIPSMRINTYNELCLLIQTIVNNIAIVVGSAITTTWTNVAGLLNVTMTGNLTFDFTDTTQYVHQLLGLSRLNYNCGPAIPLDGERMMDLIMGIRNLYLFIYGEFTDIGDLVSKHGFEDNALYANIPINLFENQQQCFIPTELQKICKQTYKFPRDLYSINITWRIRTYDGEFRLVSFATETNHIIEFIIYTEK